MGAIARRLLDRTPASSAIGALAGMILVVREALFVGVVSGTLGGSLAERYLGRMWIPFGIIVAICLVAGTILVAAALLGGFVGWGAAAVAGRVRNVFLRARGVS